MSPAALLTSLSYDPLTGDFVWSRDVSFARRADSKAGTVNKRGYITIQLGGRRYYAHRVAWLFHHGAWPTEEIDHINGDRADNRIGNLRQATRAENCRNSCRKPSAKGFPTGVIAMRGKFQARIRDGSSQKHLGTFLTAEDAHRAYIRAAEIIHGEFRASARGAA